MSGALDEDTRRTLSAGRDAAADALRAAQKDLQKVFIVFLVGFIGTFYALREAVWPFLKRTTEARMNAVTAGQVEIIAQTPFDVILLQAKIGLGVGIILASPVLLYFARDTLRARGYWPSTPVPRWKLAVIALAGLVLFVGGLAYGYLAFFPLMFRFLASNAIGAGFTPTYSIVLWAQFIFLLSLSFGLAAQLPLVMTALAYAEIVPYETFREKWRHAAVGIFAFGAMFSPPDPFTQIMWAVPLLTLYGVSLYITRLVVTAKRGSQGLDLAGTARARWNHLAGTALVGFLAVYGFYTGGGVAAANGLLARVSTRRLLAAGSTLPLEPRAAAAAWGALGALVAGLGALLYFVLRDLDARAGPGVVGDPADIDLAELDAEGVRAAPREAFEALSEEEAMAAAGAAIDADDKEKARAILDRYDAVSGAEDGEGAGDSAGGAAGAAGSATGTGGDAIGTGSGGDAAAETAGGGGGLGDRAGRAADTFLGGLTGDDTEEEIGGYYADLRFVLDSLTSRAFRIVGLFMLVLAVTFAALYRGGIGVIKRDFLRRLPEGVADPEAVGIITLHPVEALVFEVKLSAIVAAVATLPLVAYYAWPALRERRLVYGHRRMLFGWTAALLLGLAGGFVLGYAVIAPGVISYLVADALAADVVVKYRISNFAWLIFFTTIGVGLLADIPVLMVLLNTAGVRYRSMRDRWREVTVAALAFAALLTPVSVVTMFLAVAPMMVAYGVGLGALYVLTLGGRRDLAGYLGAKPAQ